MFQILSGFPDDVLAVSASGKITAEDYDRVFIPAVNEKLRRHKPLRLFFHLGPDFDGMKAGAMVKDAHFGLSHLKDWGRIALVTDAAGMRDMVNFFRVFVRAPIGVFFNADYEEAKRWVESDEAAAA